MAEEKDLVHILKLLDDESVTVRDRVWEALEHNLNVWAPGLWARLEDLPPWPRKRIREMLDLHTREGFRITWSEWRNLEDPIRKLEAALSGLSGFLGGGLAGKSRAENPKMGLLLDALAGQFRASGAPSRPTSLARFLFVEKALKGADGDYYDPGNSDLVRVMETGRGIPISLACIFILVGRRLDLAISGCDVPEHFLTRAFEEGREVIIDCYDRGKVLGPDRLAQLEKKYSPDFFQLLRVPAGPEAMVARILRNLINAYHLAGDKQASEFMWSLAEDLRG